MYGYGLPLRRIVARYLRIGWCKHPVGAPNLYNPEKAHVHERLSL